MSFFKANSFFHARFSALSIGLIGVALVGGCVEDAPGLAPASTAGSAGRSTSASGAGGNTASAGGAGTSPASAGSGDTAAQGGASAGSAAVAPTAGAAVAPAAGAGGDGEPAANPDASAGAGAGGQQDQSNEDGVHLAPVCPFHSDAAPVEGAAGAGGAGSEAPTITVQQSPFVGGYLADGTGRALYTYGGDLPGDCNTGPQSLCAADCPVSWPPFDAGARRLGPGLSDAGFGTLQRADGSYQTTYMGWPLYYYNLDLTAGSVMGQGKGKVWHLAKLSLPSVTIMKVGAIKHLADTAGRTLYVSSADQSGTADTDPVSNCSGGCLSTFEGFHDKHLSVVSSLEPLDFSVFVRHGTGGLQLAYKGMPLYRAATDLKAGDMNGTLVTGFTAAVP